MVASPEPRNGLLDQMMKAFSAKPNGKIVVPRRIKPGSVLVREWKGRSPPRDGAGRGLRLRRRSLP